MTWSRRHLGNSLLLLLLPPSLLLLQLLLNVASQLNPMTWLQLVQTFLAKMMMPLRLQRLAFLLLPTVYLLRLPLRLPLIVWQRMLRPRL